MTDSFAAPEGLVVSFQPGIVSGIRELFGQYEVVHQSKGRIRLRIPRLAKDEGYGDRLVQQLSTIVGVTQVNINRLAKSITLCYRENSNAAALVQMLLAQVHRAVPVQPPASEEGEPSELFKFDLDNLPFKFDLDNLPFKFDLDNLPFKFNLKDSPLQYAIDQASPEFRPLIYRLLLSLLQVSGGAFLAIGIVGIILPLLPGTPFLILSALCFTATKELSAMEQEQT